MKYSEFKNFIEKGENPADIYLFEGEDSFFREEGVKVLLKHFITEKSLSYASFDGEDGETGDFFASITAYPFIDRKRLTVIREFYPKKDNKQFAEFLDNPFDGGILAIVNEKPHELLKKSKNVCVVDCKKAESSTIARWIKGTCAESGVAIDLGLAQKVAEYSKCDMRRVSVETNKLIDNIGNGGTVDEKTIDELVVKDVEYAVYNMTDAVAKGNFDEAYLCINQMTEKGNPPQTIISSVYNYFRRLLHIAISGKSVQEIAKIFSANEWYIQKQFQQSRMFKKRSLKKAVDLLSDADYKIKSGLIDANEQMWISIFEIMTNKA